MRAVSSGGSGPYHAMVSGTYALRGTGGKRLVNRQMARLVHGAGVKAHASKCKNGVFNAANILVDRQPVIDRSGPRRGIINSSVKRAKYQLRSTNVSMCRFRALRRAATFWAGDMFPCRVMGQRIAGLVKVDIIGQRHRQICARLRHTAACVA